MGIELPITKDTRIGELLQAHPRASDVFTSHGLGCIVCLGASMETVEEGALMHNLDVDAIVKELNQAIGG